MSYQQPYGGHGYGAPPHQPSQQQQQQQPQQPYGGAYAQPPPQQGYQQPPPPQGYQNQARPQQGYPPQGYPPPNAASPLAPSAPPGADPLLWQWFQAVDTDRSGKLTTEELQRALINGDWTPFNLETCRVMVNMFDQDHTGTIEFHEFAGLWKYIEEWKKCFQSFDRDGSGTIDQHELRDALRTFGFNLSEAFVARMIRKFDSRGTGSVSKTANASTPANRVSFDNFIQACVTVKSLSDSFMKLDTNRTGWIQLNYESFLELVINNK